jgi:hypothetical protein
MVGGSKTTQKLSGLASILGLKTRVGFTQHLLERERETHTQREGGGSNNIRQKDAKEEFKLNAGGCLKRVYSFLWKKVFNKNNKSNK